MSRLSRNAKRSIAGIVGAAAGAYLAHTTVPGVHDLIHHAYEFTRDTLARDGLRGLPGLETAVGAALGSATTLGFYQMHRVLDAWAYHSEHDKRH